MNEAGRVDSDTPKSSGAAQDTAYTRARGTAVTASAGVRRPAVALGQSSRCNSGLASLPLQFGDAVRIEINDRRGDVSYGWVMGLPPYSKGYGDVVMVAADTWIGMPVNACWCTVVGASVDVGKAQGLRAVFEAAHPNWLAPL